MTEIAYTPKQGSLVDVLDRLLDAGVVVTGEIDLGVADIDLIHAKLNLVLASAVTLETGSCGPPEQVLEAAVTADTNNAGRPNWGALPPPSVSTWRGKRRDSRPTPLAPESKAEKEFFPSRLGVSGKNKKINMDPKKVEKGLAKLVMTVVELLRQLMEKQALRKIETNTLSGEDVERLGVAFLKLKEKCEEIKKIFGLQDEDLNLDLGPLGDLLEKDGG